MLIEQIEQQAAERELAYQQREHEQSMFFANASHEFRTPMMTLQGYLDLLADGSAGAINETQARYISNMQTALERLTHMVNDAIDLSKIEAGKMMVDLAPVSPYDIESFLCAQFEPIMTTRGIKFRCPMQQNLPEVLVDYTKMTQVLSNLLNNAAKFTEAGGEVLFTAFLDPHDEQTVVFEVRDTGKGIPEANLSRLFDKFYQVSVKDERIGSGLGLAIAKELVSLMHGEINVESEVGHGSRFTVKVPAVVY